MIPSRYKPEYPNRTIRPLKHRRYPRIEGKIKPMTIAAGFAYRDGVMVCADTQVTIGLSKIDGVKVGRFHSSWGQVICAFAGNVDFACSAFQQCERESESDKMLDDPVGYIRRILKQFYKEHVFNHPRYDTGDYDFNLLLGIRLVTEEKAKLYKAGDTVLREVKSYDCVGIGSDHGRAILRSLCTPIMPRDYALALSAYMMDHAKTHAQYCGGSSVTLGLQHDGKELDQIQASLDLANHTANMCKWFVQEAQIFMLGHTQGSIETFEDRLKILNERARYVRNLWDTRASIPLDLQPTRVDSTRLLPWPELL
jgi:20S proteasome alpha/beta subunit